MQVSTYIYTNLKHVNITMPISCISPILWLIRWMFLHIHVLYPFMKYEKTFKKKIKIRETKKQGNKKPCPQSRWSVSLSSWHFSLNVFQKTHKIFVVNKINQERVFQAEVKARASLWTLQIISNPTGPRLK